MDHRQADEIAEALGGKAVRIEGVDVDWIVVVERPDGRFVVVTETSVDEYGDHDAYKAGHCYASISLQ